MYFHLAPRLIFPAAALVSDATGSELLRVQLVTGKNRPTALFVSDLPSGAPILQAFGSARPESAWYTASGIIIPPLTSPVLCLSTIPVCIESGLFSRGCGYVKNSKVLVAESRAWNSWYCEEQPRFYKT